MRRYFVATLLILALILAGCAEFQRAAKTFESNLAGGLNRTVSVYTQDGQLLRTYEGKLDVQATEYGNKVLFDLDGKRVIIYNAVVLVEEN